MKQPPTSLESIVASRVSEHAKLDAATVRRALALLSEHLAVPYLARYRREDIGGLDERALLSIRDDADRVREMERRREFILRAMSERTDVTEKQRRRLERCRGRTELEYLYEPFRPPRKTPAAVAREQGLEPLADALLHATDPNVEAYFGPDRGVDTLEEALHGAREVLAERFAIDPEIRSAMLRVVEKEGVLTAVPAHGKSEIPGRFAHLRTYEERLARIPSHRFLALQRAEKEGAISRRVVLDDEKVRARIAQRFYPEDPDEKTKAFLDEAAAEAIRLMRPAIIEDALRAAKQRADSEAITVFRNNLCDLLLFPPAGPHKVLGVDPAPRGSIPVACIDERGTPVDHDRLKFFGKDEAKVAAARERILQMVRTHGIALVALGNGQGRRPCEAFLSTCFEELGEDAPPVVVVNEAGVGSYASGPVGRSELPALPVPVRGAVSMARRLVDPLPELVKVDPKQIGVGQYQNDVDPAQLAKALDEIVEHCVNYVGVDVNRAPVQQLAQVCGISTSVARQIAGWRDKHGPFPTLAAVAALPFVTERAFEGAAGFLRIHGGENPIDATGVHPRHMPLVERIAKGLGVAPGDLIRNGDLLHSVVAEEFADETYSPAAVAGVLFELLDGGKDPRPALEITRRSPNIRSADDLRPGMSLQGRVTNVTNFGAFVDVGVQQDGLVHVSELADYFVKDPTSVVRVGQVVSVKVLGVDENTGRISLTMKSGRGAPGGRGRRDQGPRRPRRGPRQERRPGQRPPPREEIVEPDAAPPAPVEEETAPDSEADPIPAGMSEEEYMRLKMEELRKRFS